MRYVETNQIHLMKYVTVTLTGLKYTLECDRLLTFGCHEIPYKSMGQLRDFSKPYQFRSFYCFLNCKLLTGMKTTSSPLMVMMTTMMITLMMTRKRSRMKMIRIPLPKLLALLM